MWIDVKLIKLFLILHSTPTWSSKPTAKRTSFVCLDHGQTSCQVGKTELKEHKIKFRQWRGYRRDYRRTEGEPKGG